jgi:FKBP-type peptidyl-prolyl cis-trans isomerase FklB
MKQICIVILSITLLTGVCAAEDKLDLQDEKVKLSYSVGYQVGSDFKRQGIDISPAELLQGVQDALSGSKPQMSREEMRSTLAKLQLSIKAAKEQKMQAQAEKNLADGMAYLFENSKKEGVTTLDSGLQYKVLAEGSGASPKATDTVTVNYRGTLIDGTEFDSSYKRDQPATFRVDRVIPGWTEALQLMQEGDKWTLFIPANLAYGERRAGPIEPHSTLIFDVELISVNKTEQ